MKGRGRLLFGLPLLLLAAWAGLQVMEERAILAAVEASQRRWDCLVEQNATNPACADPRIARSEDADRCPHAVAVCRGQGLYAAFDDAFEQAGRWAKARALLLSATLLVSIALASSWGWRWLKRRWALRASRSRSADSRV
ncbi:hypothetical protein ACS5PN_19555 [Roseateles sp. NT4]|uniref:hypothetical protein n=1 Tax=Roseateles sp. NT4 TaxID=3453715 RepID=UPI003EF049A4